MTAQSIGRCVACCGLCLIQSASAADSAATPDVAAQDSGGPAFEAAVDFCSRQLTYGLVDNRDPVVTLEALAEWHGFTFEAAAIFDTTSWGSKHGGYGNRNCKHQEFAFGPGYVYTFSPDDFAALPTAVELSVSYIYEWHPPVQKWRGEENPHTQFINAGVALPDLWLAPAFSAEFDIENEAGAIYLAAEVGHSFDLTDTLAFALGAGVGFGNPKRNKYDAGFDTYAFKDIWASAALEWRITETLMLSPYAAVYEQLHRRLRDAARDCIDDETHSSAQLIGGLRLAASF